MATQPFFRVWFYFLPTRVQGIGQDLLYISPTIHKAVEPSKFDCLLSSCVSEAVYPLYRGIPLNARSNGEP